MGGLFPSPLPALVACSDNLGFFLWGPVCQVCLVPEFCVIRRVFFLQGRKDCSPLICFQFQMFFLALSFASDPCKF